MADVRYGFDGAANGAAATTASTGLASINASGTAGSTLVHQNTGSADGAGHLLLTPVAGGVLQGIANMTGMVMTQIKLKQDALPVNTANIAQWRDAAALVATLQILNTGRLKLGDWTSAAALSAMPGWMRLVFWRPLAGTSYKVGLFEGESTTPYEPIFTGGAIGTANTPLSSFRFGRVVAATETTPLRMDSVFMTDTAADISTAPFTPAAPPVIIGDVDTTHAWLDLRASTPANAVWTVPAGVTTITPGVYRMDRTSADQVFTFTATDTAGLVSSRSFTVPKIGPRAELLVSTGGAFV